MTDRLDAVMADRGLAPSRTRAARLIASGAVLVDGAVAGKAALRVDPAAVIEVVAADRYVSRAAHKLEAALDEFGVAVAGRLALDAGASTGGFSQVLLERGAARVIAVDVGHGQLAPAVARDPRIRSHEGVNVRNLDPAALAELTGGAERPDLVVADLSFISLTRVIPALVSVAAEAADFVLLVKPQFEVGRTGVKGGLVRSRELRIDAVRRVLAAAADAGLGTAGLCRSPITGTSGNREYLAHLTSRVPPDPTEWSRRVTKVVDA